MRARRMPPIQKTCEWCSQPFLVAASQSHKRKYCSRACGRASVPPTPELDCETCGKRFIPDRGNWLRGYGKYCSGECYGVAKGRQNQAATVDRFWARVDKSGDCWVWRGARYKKGYGRFSTVGKEGVLASHFAWQLVHGPIPPGMLLCHRCDNPPCVRVDHLFLGTAADNSADMVTKGRQTSGEKNGNAVLTDAIVREARRRYGDRTDTMASLAKEYGIKLATMKYAVSGRGWRHVTP